MKQPSTSSSGQHQPQPQPQSHTILQIAPQPPVRPPEMPRNVPRLDLLEGSREEYSHIGLPLYEAAIKGDWKAAKTFLEKRRELIRFAITENHETLLHVAASAGSTKAVEEFVINLVNLMEKEDLELQNKSYDTALSLTAAVGNVRSAMIMVKKNPKLVDIPSKNRIMPLYKAALFAKPDMVRYLYDISRKMSGDFWSQDNRGWVLRQCVEADIFDVATQIVDDHPEVLRRELLTDVLRALAQKPHAFKNRKPRIFSRIMKSMFHVKESQDEILAGKALHLLRIICRRIANMSKSEIDDILRGPPRMAVYGGPKRYPSRILFLATKMGNTPLIVELIRIYPDAIWKQDDKGKTIFHLAVKCRNAEIYNLLNEIGAMKELITPIKDNKGNNMLHMVANRAKEKSIQDVSGVALELQRELLWYKEVEQTMPPSYRQRKNSDDKTPEELFARKYADMFKHGEDWISNYALVATLILTIVFAAAFTLPGGYNQITGIPFFRKEPALIIFVISDAISLISSSSCVLIFISIFTSRYADRDYVRSLPTRLLWGIVTLFLSIATMMIAFSASFFLLYNKKLEWVPITVTGLACVPVLLFAKMQYHIIVDILNFTFRPRHIFTPKKRILYY